MDRELFDNVRGALYIPAKVFHSYQQWSEFSKEEAARDMGYAATVNLNALRVFASYELWLEKPEVFAKAFDDFLDAAAEKKIRIMPVVFEDCGREPSPEAFADRDIKTAVAIKSPGSAVTSDPNKWEACGKYLDWFMQRYGSDNRIIAIEIMNEPHIKDDGTENVAFARAMYERATKQRGSLPLTIGNIGMMMHNIFFMEYGLDIIQFHDNFPRSVEAFESNLRFAKETQRILNKPVWITEWQRVRENGPGWDTDTIDPEYTLPKLRTLAPSIHKFGLGNFFWSLMVKPAYLIAQRPNGTFNGLFHEDGAVYSLEDARAVSGNPNFMAEERTEPPASMKA